MAWTMLPTGIADHQWHLHGCSARWYAELRGGRQGYRVVGSAAGLQGGVCFTIVITWSIF